MILFKENKIEVSTKKNSISILLSTYNGEKYLQEQLESLLGQTFCDFEVLIRDDGSTDGTLDIINDYMTYDSRFVLIKDDKGNIGSSLSFFELLKYSTTEYIMFCDQDDVWLPNKIELSLQKIQVLEKENNEGIPLLVFSDLEVVDENLQSIDKSFWSYQKILPNIGYIWKKLLAQNMVTGCTMIFNKDVKKYLSPLAFEYMDHDHYIAVIISKYGKLSYINQSLLKYRQHSFNIYGSTGFKISHLIKKIKEINKILIKLRFCSSYFKDISFSRLFYYKIIINLQRFNK